MKERILIEDDFFIALSKNSGELVVADRWGIEKNILLHEVGKYLRANGHEIDSSGRDLYPVHRLDRETSGVVLFAKNHEAHKALSLLFESREMKKTYWAFVRGEPLWTKCEVNIPLLRAEGKKGRGRSQIQLNKGKPSLTIFHVKEKFEKYTLIEANPVTGRLHQIRVHLNLLGHPILNDKSYGENNQISETSLLSRMALHARKIEFQHPFSKKSISIEAPLGEELRTFYNELKNSI
ncbi:MAG: RluA family pseudouridine synthase [Oligoflexia bacterium]|nr:RluA family pseudouridine synthase [Oligoflexia bacterium]